MQTKTITMLIASVTSDFKNGKIIRQYAIIAKAVTMPVNAP